MIVRLACGFSVLALLTACATSDPGWTGTGAEPFDQALADCHTQVDVIPEQVEREPALDRCMAAKGWTRG